MMRECRRSGASSLVWIEEVTFQPGWRSQFHAHNDCDELLLVVDGVFQGDTPTSVSPMRRGTGLLHPRGAPHQEWIVGHKPGRLLTAGIRRPRAEAASALRFWDTHGRAECGLRWLSDLQVNAASGGVQEAGLLEAVLEECQRLARLEQARDAEVDEAQAFIQQNACRGLSVQQVADHVGLGRRTLERRFQRCLHRSPRQEILRRQLEQARQMLVHTHLKLDEIAAQCGFGDAKAFRACFRAAFGRLPALYRRDACS